MQVDAIYDHGRLEFVQPIQLKHERLSLIVQIPDSEIIKQVEPYQLSKKQKREAAILLDRLQRVRDRPLSSEDRLSISEKKLDERLESMTCRDEIRALR
jgi:hypothetical protein